MGNNPTVTLETIESPRKHRYQTVLEQPLYNPALSGKMDPESHFGYRSRIWSIWGPGRERVVANVAKAVCLVAVC